MVTVGRIGEPQVCFSEICFRDVIGPYVFEGRIDQIRRTGSGWVLIDLKTDKKRPSDDFLRRSFQLSLYAHAIRFGVLFEKDENGRCGEEITIGEVPEIYWYQLTYLLPYKKNQYAEFLGKSANKRPNPKFYGGYKKGDLRGDPLIPAHRAEQGLIAAEDELRYIVQGIRMNICSVGISTRISRSCSRSNGRGSRSSERSRASSSEARRHGGSATSTPTAA